MHFHVNRRKTCLVLLSSLDYLGLIFWLPFGYQRYKMVLYKASRNRTISSVFQQNIENFQTKQYNKNAIRYSRNEKVACSSQVTSSRKNRCAATVFSFPSQKQIPPGNSNGDHLGTEAGFFLFQACFSSISSKVSTAFRLKAGQNWYPYLQHLSIVCIMTIYVAKRQKRR